MNHKLKYPYLHEVKEASIQRIAYWYKELPSPDGTKDQIKYQQKVMELIKHRFETGDI